MEQKFYKIRLLNDRVLGPIDLNRIKLFIQKNVISGTEKAKIYPDGEWKEISKYPEIAEILLQKIEGKLNVSDNPIPTSDPNQTLALEQEPNTVNLSEVPEPPQIEVSHNIKHKEEIKEPEELTVIMSSKEERTIMMSKEEKKFHEEPKFEIHEQRKADVDIANEKTSMLELPRVKKISEQNKKSKKKKLIAVGAALGVALLFLFDNDKSVQTKALNFRVELPVFSAANPELSIKAYTEGLRFYAEDTIIGYKNAAIKFLTAAKYNSNDPKPLYMLASSYMNLLYVIPSNDEVFSVISRLIDLAHAKESSSVEAVIADVELYHIFANPDAAISRIIEYSKKVNGYTAEMYYYLAISFFYKEQYDDSLKYLNTLNEKNWFSARVPYLLAQIYKKQGLLDESIKYFEKTLEKSKGHTKAKLELARLYFLKDKSEDAKKQVEYIIGNKSNSSKEDLARAYYIHARILELSKSYSLALTDLETALKLLPEDSDIILEYFTVKARVGADEKGSTDVAKMFSELAKGEWALKSELLDEALAHYVVARELQYNNALPLIRIAEVFKRKGDLESSKINYKKAVELDPKNIDLLGKYIHALIQAFDFSEALRQIEKYKALSPLPSMVDRLHGELYFKQNRLQEAQAFYKNALASGLVDPNLYIEYADVLFKGGLYKDSSFYYGLALRFNPFNAEAVTGAAKAISEVDGVDKAVEYIETIIRKSYKKEEFLNGVAEVYIYKGDASTALEYANQSLKLNSKYAEAYKTKAKALAALEKFDDALDVYLTYANLTPLEPTGRIERFKIYLKKPDLELAYKELERVRSSFPHFPGLYYLFGELYKESKDNNSAIKAVEKELAQNPYYLPAYVLMATLYNTQNEPAKALGLVNKALSMNPKYVAAMIQAAFANQKLKLYAAAEAILERARSINESDPQIYRQYGLLYIDQGDRDRAKEYFRVYLDLYPQAPDRKEVQKYLR